MEKEIKINNYGTVAAPKWSVDRYVEGQYLEQLDFFFGTRDEAETRALELATDTEPYTDCDKRANA